MTDNIESILRRLHAFEGRAPAGFKFDRDDANERGRSPSAFDNARTDLARQPEGERAEGMVHRGTTGNGGSLQTDSTAHIAAPTEEELPELRSVFVRRVQDVLRRHGWTHAIAAQHCGISPARLEALLANRLSDIGRAEMTRIAARLDIAAP